MVAPRGLARGMWNPQQPGDPMAASPALLAAVTGKSWPVAWEGGGAEEEHPPASWPLPPRRPGTPPPPHFHPGNQRSN